MKYFIFIFSILIFSNVYAADSQGTKMYGVTTVCTAQSAFIAINVADQKVWFGQEYLVGEMAFELDEVKVEKNNNQLTFTGIYQMTWGQDIYRNKMEGTIVDNQGQVKVVSLVNGQTVTNVLVCN